MLSVLMQCTVITAVVMVIYVLYGYSMSFGGGESPYWGGFGKAFLGGVTPDSESGTIPELVFVAFQMTFACITPALIVGGFAERMKFSAVVLFVILWVTIVYFPIAHMAWDAAGLYFNWGAYDFAGGTVVHINAGIAALVGRAADRAAHRLPQGDHGAALDDADHGRRLDPLGRLVRLQCRLGALSAGGIAGLAMMNTFVATAGAVLSWSVLEAMSRGKASMLGAASGHGGGPRRGHAGGGLRRAGRRDRPRRHRVGLLLLLRAGGEGEVRL